jgi:predicted house-cleaning NTP pyrophosphatase (Maf/HAM1 superfamily)
VKATSHGKILATLEILDKEGSIDPTKEYVVICCDTVVEKDGIIYEKPVDLAQQQSWLR